MKEKLRINEFETSIQEKGFWLRKYGESIWIKKEELNDLNEILERTQMEIMMEEQRISNKEKKNDGK